MLRDFQGEVLKRIASIWITIKLLTPGEASYSVVRTLKPALWKDPHSKKLRPPANRKHPLGSMYMSHLEVGLPKGLHARTVQLSHS